MIKINGTPVKFNEEDVKFTNVDGGKLTYNREEKQVAVVSFTVELEPGDVIEYDRDARNIRFKSIHG